MNAGYKKDYAVKKIALVVLVYCVSAVLANPGSGFAGEHRLGAGLQYWASLDSIEEEGVEESGFGGVISYQYRFAVFFALEADLEFLGEGYAGTQHAVYTPMGYLLFGKILYGGVGVGINYSNGEWAKEPLFGLRAGLDFPIFPSLYLDINGNYRFQKWELEEIQKDIDIDTITLGAVLRYQF